MSQPFLTILTRCCKRPRMLAKNIASVREQTDKDIEQVFVIDRYARGRLWANQHMEECKKYVRGQYVYILDDDCRLIHPNFVEQVKKAVKKKSVDVVMVQCSRPQIRPKVLPRREGWGKPKKICGKQVNCLCYVIKRELWNTTIRYFGTGVSGAGRFFDALMKFSPTMAWVHIIVAETMQLGRDGGFEKVQPEWPDLIVRQHHMQFMGEDVWAIQHWR